MTKLIIFDLDGTLCNTIYDLASAVNYALNKMGYPTHSIDVIQGFVGNGIRNLIIRSMPEKERTDEKIDVTKKFFFDYYKIHFADKTVAYDGIEEMLKALKEKGVKLAVCTNKEHNMASEVVKKCFADTFDMVIGQSDKFPLKPEPDSSLYIMETYKAKREDTVFIGDSGVDIKTAKNLGVRSIGVSWGFRERNELLLNGADMIADTPLDITNLFEV